MAKAACICCIWEKETGKAIDTSRSKVAWGKKVGVSEASVRRHLAHSQREESDDNSAIDDPFLALTDIPEGAVTSRGMSIRDPESGSWQKVTWQPNKKALLDALQYDDLDKALDGWEPKEFAFPKLGSSAASVLNMADLQIGKAMQRGGGTPETIAGVHKSVQAFIEHIVANNIRTAVLVDNGDPVENVWNTPSQLVTNDLDVPAQIRTFRKLMIQTIKTVAPFVEEIYYVSIPSNHGAFRTGYKAQGGTTDADFGLEISHQLEDVIHENEHLRDKVKFIRPRDLHETAELQVAGTKLAFHHGHQSGGVHSHGKFWSAQDHGRLPGWDADIFVFGHYHTQALYQSGDGRWVVACASSDPGSDWFTNRTGEAATRGMTMFDVLDGMWSNLAVI